MESILLTRLTQTDSPPGQTESLHVIRLRLRHSIFSFSRFSLIRLFISHFIQFIPFMQTKNAQAQPSCTTPLHLVGVFNIKKDVNWSILVIISSHFYCMPYSCSFFFSSCSLRCFPLVVKIPLLQPTLSIEASSKKQ